MIYCYFFLANNVTQQKLQCIKGEDGKIQFKGLLPGTYAFYHTSI